MVRPLGRTGRLGEMGFGRRMGPRGGGGGVIPKKIVAEGDSITSAAGSYANLWATDNPTITFTNKAVGGAVIGTSADRAPAVANSLYGRLNSVVALAPTHVSILIGANDLGTDPAAYITRLQNYITDLRAGVAGVKVLVATMTPQAIAYSATFNTHRATANASIRAGVGTWVDGLIPFGDEPNYSSNAAAENVAYYGDGLHPTSFMQGILKTIYAAVMDAVIANDGDAVPQQFTFTDQLAAAINTDYTATATIRGIGLGQTATASITGDGTFAVGLGAYSTGNKSLFGGDTAIAKVTSGATIPTTKAQVMTIGGVSDTFTVTTATPPATTVLNGTTGTEKSSQLTITGTPALVCTGSATGDARCVAATQTTSGKTQWEATVTTYVAAWTVYIGFFDGSTDMNSGAVAPGRTDTAGVCLLMGDWGYEIWNANSNTQFNYSSEEVSGGSPAALGRRLATGDVISVVRDDVANTITFYRTRSGSTVIIGVAEGSLSDTFNTGFLGASNSHVLTANFGQSAFARTLDSGFVVYG